MSTENGQYRFTSIIVAQGATQQMYRSLEDLPEGSRQALLDATNGDCTATILIADEAGERFLQEVVKARQPEPEAPPPASPGFWRTTGWRWTVELAICSGAAFLLWFLATLK